MLKKIVLGTMLVGGGTLALLGTSAYSYIRTGYQSIRQEIKCQIPVEVEIRRARDMITNLTPEIADNLHKIAREEVEVSRLSKELVKKTELQTKSKREILRLKDDVSAGSEKLVYAGRSYSVQQVRDDLNSRFKQFQSHVATTDKLGKVLEAREKNLNASRAKLDEMLEAKRQLEIEVESLQARLTMVQVAETSSNLAINDSQLNQTRTLLDEIANRIDVAEKLAENEGVMHTTIPLDEVAPTDIVEAISNYFADQLDDDRIADNK